MDQLAKRWALITAIAGSAADDVTGEEGAGESAAPLRTTAPRSWGGEEEDAGAASASVAATAEAVPVHGGAKRGLPQHRRDSPQLTPASPQPQPQPYALPPKHGAGSPARSNASPLRPPAKQPRRRERAGGAPPASARTEHSADAPRHRGSETARETAVEMRAASPHSKRKQSGSAPDSARVLHQPGGAGIGVIGVIGGLAAPRLMSHGQLRLPSALFEHGTSGALVTERTDASEVLAVQEREFVAAFRSLRANAELAAQPSTAEASVWPRDVAAPSLATHDDAGLSVRTAINGDASVVLGDDELHGILAGDLHPPDEADTAAAPTPLPRSRLGDRSASALSTSVQRLRREARRHADSLSKQKGRSSKQEPALSSRSRNLR